MKAEDEGPLYVGTCFCGAVAIEATGAPAAMGYCHCESCRSWSASPIHCSTIWAAEDVRITQGAQQVATFHKTRESISHRQFCRNCGGHLMIAHPTLGVVDVMAATLPGLEFEPILHVNYAETVLPMMDGLPKYRDFPIEFGGSGETVPE
ncbi:GFA family protein [Altererythrobacter litoralis]|uniref:GFA family protein n=1 Tax=Altererythrobacter litoralis TaxID=3113904 RepID=A0ABU7GDQ1_9SPHN|nr:GFA family protein [Erythrobacteraceae bacterium 1XM1-14]